MLLIENSTDYFSDCFKGTEGNCPAPDVGPCPYAILTSSVLSL